MIEAKGLTKYYGNFPAIENVSFDVKSGEVLGFLGPNGSGKTTSMRTIIGLTPADRGQILFEGIDITKLHTKKIAKLGHPILSKKSSVDEVSTSAFLITGLERCKPTFANIQPIPLWEIRNSLFRLLN